jgi:hypothetical protein
MNIWIRRSLHVGTVSASIVLASAAVAQAQGHQAGLAATKAGIVSQIGQASSATASVPQGGTNADGDTDPGIPAGAQPSGGVANNAQQPDTDPGTPAGAPAYGNANQAQQPEAPAAAPAAQPAAAPPAAAQPAAAQPAAAEPAAAEPAAAGGPVVAGRDTAVIVIVDDDDFGPDFYDDDLFDGPRFGHGPGRWHRWDSCRRHHHGHGRWDRGDRWGNNCRRHHHGRGGWGCDSFRRGHDWCSRDGRRF